jgi:hypothetical protein
MSERGPRQELGRLARISGEVRAASARWEVELQRTVLQDGAAQPGDADVLDRLCRGVSVDCAPPPAYGAPHFPEFQAERRHRRSASYDAGVAAALLVALGVLALGLHATFSPSEERSPAAPRLIGPPPLLEHPPGSEAERALASQARALAARGQDVAEAEAWRKLLERYPESVHRARACASFRAGRGSFVAVCSCSVAVGTLR